MLRKAALSGQRTGQGSWVREATEMTDYKGARKLPTVMEMFCLDVKSNSQAARCAVAANSEQETDAPA